MDLPTYQRWCWEGDGTYHTARQRVKWLVDDLAQEHAMRARDRQHESTTFGTPGRIRWLGGGPCDPHDSCYFEDEGGAA